MKTSGKLRLSVIIPAYKEEKTIEQDIHKTLAVLKALDVSYELFVVVDGYLDQTYDYAKRIKDRHVTILGYKINKGKGYAIREGLKRAKGELIAFIDAGGDIDVQALALFYQSMIAYQADIVVGSKLHKLSDIEYPWYRSLLSVGYRMLIKLLFGFSVSETQVGCKMYRREIIKKILLHLWVNRFAFDIEMLAVSYHFGFTKILEEPVRVKLTTHSYINVKNFLVVIFHMASDTFLVKYRLMTGYYNQ